MARHQPNDTLEIEAGIIKDKSPLDILKKTWNKASRKERRLFLDGSKTRKTWPKWKSGSKSPDQLSPGRRSRRTWAFRWLTPSIPVSRAPRSRKALGRFQKRIGKKIDSLAENPRPPGVEKLSGREDSYRVRVGDYRIIYRIHDKVLLIVIVEVGHRREVYRR